MKKIIFFLLVIMFFTSKGYTQTEVDESECVNESMASFEKYRMEHNARNIPRRDEVVDTIARVLKAFDAFTKEQGRAGYLVGIKTYLQSKLGLATTIQENFEHEVKRATLILAPMAWKESTAYDSPVRNKQLKRFSRFLPSRYDTWERALSWLSVGINLIFPEQSAEFYEKLWRDISEESGINVSVK